MFRRMVAAVLETLAPLRTKKNQKSSVSLFNDRFGRFRAMQNDAYPFSFPFKLLS